MRRATCYSLRHSAQGWHFYPRSPCGERQFASAGWLQVIYNFYPRSPCGERPKSREYATKYHPSISIHALLAESDKECTLSITNTAKFLSTLSLRRATFNACCAEPIHAFLSTLSLRRATTGSKIQHPGQVLFLSTLSLRRATPCAGRIRFVSMISIHALLAESDLDEYNAQQGTQLFLSTLSLRRATSLWVVLVRRLHDFYPRSPCGERHVTDLFTGDSILHFYPRSPCGERPRKNAPT